MQLQIIPSLSQIQPESRCELGDGGSAGLAAVKQRSARKTTIACLRKGAIVVVVVSDFVCPEE
jgi:hypothetical protein